MLNILILLLIAYVGFCTYLYFTQERLIFFPTRELEQTPSAYGWDYESVPLAVGDEETAAWFVPADEGARGTVLFSHGNAGNIGDRLESVAAWRNLGFDVLIYDYGGYGESTGEPGETRCYDDIRAAYYWLLESKKVSPERIVLFGRSLGAGPTLQLATEEECRVVIVESAFRSAPQLGSEVYWWLPVKLLSRNRFDNEAKISTVRVPVMVAHSPDDTIIPYAHGRALFAAANDPKVFLEFHGDHNEGFWLSGETYRRGLDAFLQQYFDNSV